MKKQKGHGDFAFLGWLVVFGLVCFVLLIIAAPIGGYFAWESHKERGALIRECERDLPREQHCEIVLTAVPVKGEKQ
jgi:hypothetical protein